MSSSPSTEQLRYECPYCKRDHAELVHSRPWHEWPGQICCRAMREGIELCGEIRLNVRLPFGGVLSMLKVTNVRI